MNTLCATEIKENINLKDIPISLSWEDSPSTQRLLDVISNIIASEYIQIAKQNPEIFKKSGVNK